MNFLQTENSFATNIGLLGIYLTDITATQKKFILLPRLELNLKVGTIVVGWFNISVDFFIIKVRK